MTGPVPFAFPDGKDPAAFRTIGEVAQAFGLRQHVLRYWEEQFPMLKPLKRAGGRRYYRPEDVRLVSEISRLLYQEGFTIRGARQALAGKGKSPASESPAEPEPPPERPGEELERTAPALPSDAGGELGARLRLLRDQLAEALHGG
jgi:DNA-binding transcriptional MerR regulator